MKRLFTIGLLSIFSISSLFAQNDDDVFRYSQLNISGDARFTAMGGSFGALGGNFSALSTNPAGIGLYQNGDFMFTPSFTMNSTNSKYIDNKTYNDNAYQFNISNAGIAGIVWEGSRLAPNEWRKVQLGFGFNRQADFNSRSYAESYINNISEDNQHSRLYDFRGLWRDQNYDNTSQWINYDDFFTGPLYDVGLLSFDSALPYPDCFYSVLDANGNYSGGLTQSKQTETSGGISEMVFTAGGNFSDWFYIGGTIGVPFLRYNSTSYYSEKDTKGEYDFLNEWSLTENSEVWGSGVNGKLGMIFRPIDYLRLGLAFHSPTFYRLTENYWTRAEGSTTDLGENSSISPSVEWEYNIITPARIIASAGLVVQQLAVFNVDVEFVNYKSMKYRNDDDFDQERAVNSTIQDKYRATANVRVGGELNLSPFKIRAGYQYQGYPYADKSMNNWSNHSYSFGLGLISKDIYLDVAYVLQMKTNKEALYVSDLFPDNMVSYKENKSLLIGTIGFRF